MCGIAGILNLDQAPASPVLLKRMTDAQVHRGPDSEGQYIDGSLGLGHRRLSIIDLSPAGHQPMMSDDGRFVISYNGEVYNFAELRVELEALGHHFRSRSDTEVVLKALAQWDVGALDKFNGMFAFALWDRRERELLLARDRYGIKPLYYYLTPTRLLFSSEVKGILAHDSYDCQLDLEGLVEYMTFQNFFTDRTLFRGVRLMPAGTYLRIGHDGKTAGPVRYWDYQFVEPTSAQPREAYAATLSQLLQQAVGRQMVSDVDVGAYLSGGMDSGTVTSLASRQHPYIKSFTCGFDLTSASGIEMSYDERPAAEHMSYVFKTEHYEMVLKAGDMERVLPRLAWHLEEPRVGQSYPNYYAAQLAGRFVKVVLAGTGGDELFGGYPWRYYRAVVNNDFDHYIDKYFAFWQRLITSSETENVFAPVWRDVKHVNTRDLFADVFTRHAPSLTTPEDYVQHSLYFEARTFLHGLLVVEDKLSMAHSLESRVPFLDNDLVDFAMKLPVGLKLGNLAEVVRLNENEPGYKTQRYFQKTSDGKLLLRQVMEQFVPPAVVQREKQGFSAPDASWFKGESVNYVRRILYNSNAHIYDFFDRKAIQGMVDQHLNGQKNLRLLIWSLLNIEQWCRTFLHGERPQPAALPTPVLQRG